MSYRPNRPRVAEPMQFGNPTDFWVEYPSGLIDVSRTAPLSRDVSRDGPPPLSLNQLQIDVQGDRIVRFAKEKSAIVIIDMQNYFLHPELRDHKTGLKCVDPLLKMVPALRSHGVKILWVNWGLTEHELETIPPTLARSFGKTSGGGFGSTLPGNFGRLLMRGEPNADLYGPLQDLYEQGEKDGSDFWIHKNRISGLWGYQTALDLFLKENGITTLFFGGVNADQCVLGTLADSYFRGYDCIVVEDTIATTSPEGGLSNVLYNASGTYGFVTHSECILEGCA